MVLKLTYCAVLTGICIGCMSNCFTLLCELQHPTALTD